RPRAMGAKELSGRVVAPAMRATLPFEGSEVGEVALPLPKHSKLFLGEVLWSLREGMLRESDRVRFQFSLMQAPRDLDLSPKVIRIKTQGLVSSFHLVEIQSHEFAVVLVMPDRGKQHQHRK